ncbi:MAG: GNAT family N-acetyltransferase [Bacteroidales bacterium]|nr:GNAT family N-acetyltransferase [Bacteroidales bacterium]
MSTIKLVTVKRLAEVMEIYRDATRKMDEMNIFQWDKDYPTWEIIEEDIRAKTMYGYFEEDEICAVGVLNEKQSEEYKEIQWNFPDDKPLVLHRLVVSPKHQNKGISKQMIRFSEEYAEKHQYKTIRFDAFMKNPVSTGVYQRAGYTISGTVTFRKGEFYCFEKKTSHYDR